jgi:hypothetical protein
MMKKICIQLYFKLMNKILISPYSLDMILPYSWVQQHNKSIGGFNFRNTTY